MRLHPSIVFIAVGIVIAIIITIIVITLIIKNHNKDRNKNHNNTGPVPQGSSKYLKAYVEDCQQSESLNYKIKELLSLKLIGFDFSYKCYDSITKNIQKLIDNNYNGKIFIHPDQTNRSPTCGKHPSEPLIYKNYKSVVKNCIDTMKKKLGNNFYRIDGILWEKEGNKFMNECQTNDCAILFKNFKFAGWANNFNFIPKLTNSWNYIFYQYYNIYTNTCSIGPTNKKCFVDYNPKFNTAICGKSKSMCKQQNQTNTVYCTKLTTPEERGSWIATVLIKSKNGKLTDVINPGMKFIYFPFTNISFPSFINTLTTAAEFDRFVESFISTLTAAGCTNINQCTFGAWGCPKWIADSTSTFCKG